MGIHAKPSAISSVLLINTQNATDDAKDLTLVDTVVSESAENARIVFSPALLSLL